MRFIFFVLFVLVLPVQAGWVQVDSPNFTVISEVGVGRAREIARYFEQARVVLESRYPKFKLDGGEQQVIFALKSNNSLKLYMPNTFEKERSVSSVHYNGWMRRDTLVRGDLQDKAYDTALWGMASSTLYRNFSHMPDWMHYGLAQYFSTIEVSKNQINVGMTIDYVNVLTNESWTPLEDIVNAKSSRDFETNSRRIMYQAEAWLLVHYALMSKQGRQSTYLEDLLALEAQGLSPVEALNKVFGSVTELQKKLRIYAKTGRYAYYTEKSQLKVAYESYPATELSENQVLGFRAALWASTKAGTVTEEDLTKLQAAVAEPGVASNLGQTLYNLDKIDEAMKVFSQIPEDQLTWIDAFLLKDNKTLSKTAIIGYLEKSLALNPHSSRVATELARALQMIDIKRSAALMAQAVANDPARLDLRIGLGYFLTYAGDYPKAIEVARFARSMARTPAEIQRVETELIQPLQKEMDRAEGVKTSNQAAAATSIQLKTKEKADAVKHLPDEEHDYSNYARMLFTGGHAITEIVDPEGFKVDKTELSAKCKKATQAVLDGELSQAETLLDEILAENGDYEPALDLVVHLKCILKKSDEAETALLHYAEISKQPKNVGERYFQLAEVLTQQKLTGPIGQKIESYLKRADTLTNGGIPLTNFYLGQLYMAFGLEEQALAPFEKYLQSNDTSNWRFQAEESVKYLKEKLKK